ncbi:MAG: histidine phosphatase family protein, partial [SAR324 cluster bacterium]|nr:histidine phosphatase family protein [SAR324 cluster bacterium]
TIMKETEITLIRHGETEWNSQQRMQGHSNSDLSAEGRGQIQALGKWMKYVSFDHIYSSDTLRAMQTAKAITQYTGHTLHLDKRIREKNLGVFEGLTSNEAKERFPDVYNLFKTAGRNYVIDKGESTQQLLDRSLEFIEEIRLRHPDQRVVIVTHGGVVRVLMKHTLGLSIDAPTNFMIKNTGIFGLIWKENWLVTQMGEVSHLEK